MKRREAIHFPVPPREVRLAGAPARNETEERIRERERESFERGRREGAQAREEELARERSELAELQKSVLASLRQAVPQVIHDCEQSMVSLALEVARKLVGEMPVSAGMIESAVREALGEVESFGGVTIFLHPDDMELLQQAGSPVLQSVSGGTRVEFEPSDEVTRGGCLVRTRFGVIDALRETKFAALKHALAA